MARQMRQVLEDLGDNSKTSRNFRKLASLLIDTGGRAIGIRWGTGTVAFTAATDSAPTTITHGLGKTPSVIFVTNATGVGFANIAAYTTEFKSATSFNVYARIPVANTITLQFYWIAIG